MKLRILALAATAGVAVAMIPAHGATLTPAPKPQIVDQKGDANGINDQGEGSPVQVGVATGVDDSNADITSVLFATQYKTVTTTKKVTTVVKGKKVTKTVTTTTRTPNGFTVTLTLDAPADANHNYDVWADNDKICPDGDLDFTYSTGQFGLNEIDCVPGLTSASTDIQTIAGDAKAVGNTVVWTVPAGAIPNGTSLSNLAAYTETAAFAIGTLDEANGGTATYTVGS